MNALRIGMGALGCAFALAWQGAAVHAQAFEPMAAGATPNFRAPASYQRVTGQSNPALTYFGGSRAVHQTPATGRTYMAGPQPVQSAAYVKPYQGLQPTPSISPYLALDQRETEGGVPNYYLFVKPQLDQHAANQQVQLQNRRLQQQLRRASTTGILPRTTSGGIPTTGHSTQFMNQGGYYPQLTR